MARVTKRQAEFVLIAVRRQFASWIFEGDRGPQVRHDGVRYTIVWEDGSPFEWAVKDPFGDVDEEFGSKIPARRQVKGVYTEPINSYVLGLYPE